MPSSAQPFSVASKSSRPCWRRAKGPLAEKGICFCSAGSQALEKPAFWNALAEAFAEWMFFGDAVGKAVGRRRSGPGWKLSGEYVDRYGDRVLSRGTGASDIAQWLPELRSNFPEFSLGAADQESPQARFRIFDSVTRLLARAASTKPLAVIIDDLHAADDASVMLLEFLARALDGVPLLVVATFRDLELRDRPVLSRFLGGPHAHATPMTLRGLTEVEVATLLGSGCREEPPPDVVRRVLKATNGNPFLVREIARTDPPTAKDGRLDSLQLKSFRVPDRVADIVRRHLRHCFLAGTACKRNQSGVPLAWRAHASWAGLATSTSRALPSHKGSP
jgi:hypothetical protein